LRKADKQQLPQVTCMLDFDDMAFPG